MNVSALRLQARLLHGDEIKQLDLIDAEFDRITLAPLFTLFEGSEATITFDFPKQLEIEHLTQGLLVPVTVRSSDITGLLLMFKELPEAEQDRWAKIVEHLREHVGRLARANPRVAIPEFNFAFRFSGRDEKPGKVFDISVGGIRVLSDASVEVGDLIEFLIEVPGGPEWEVFANKLKWQGVVKNKETRGFGLQFSRNVPFQHTVATLVEGLAKRRLQRLKYPRYNILESDVWGEFQTVELATAKGHIKDISISGTYLLTDSLLPLDHSISIHILSNSAFGALAEPLVLTGKVVRGTPDGLIVQFSELEEVARSRLGTWVNEIAGKFRGAAEPATPEVAAKATLNISYGSDLLLVNEYLYNLSAGGFFLSTPLPLNKGDTVRFVMDLAGTSIADRFSAPPTFLGTVMRTTETGIGVQFVRPDEVRAQLETALSGLLRKTKDEKPTEFPDDEELLAETPTSHVPTPTMGLSIFFIIVVTIGFVFLYRRTLLQPASISVDDLALQPSSGTTQNAETTSEIPDSVQIVDGSFVRTVVIADITDVAFDPQVGPKVVMTDGTMFPGTALIQFLSPALREKVEELRKKAMEEMRREKAKSLALSRAELQAPFQLRLPPRKSKQ